jgi:hypothetical protein
VKAKVTFRKLIQDSQEYGSNDEHLVSRVFFDLEIGENGIRICTLISNKLSGVTLRQPP